MESRTSCERNDQRRVRSFGEYKSIEDLFAPNATFRVPLRVEVITNDDV